MLLMHIIQHTSVSSNSKTLIDSILSNILGLDSVLGNLTNNISHYLIATNWQTLIKKALFLTTSQKTGILHKITFLKITFIKYLSFQNFLGKTNFILNDYNPKKKASKKTKT